MPKHDEDLDDIIDPVVAVLEALDRMGFLWVSNDKGHIIDEPDLRAVAAQTIVEMFPDEEEE